MTKPAQPEDIAPVWITILLITILVVAMFAAGFMLGGHYYSGPALDAAKDPSFGDLTFEADSGIIRRDPS